MSTLQVGIATVDCTPRPGLPLLGNFRDDYAARGVHDPLSAKAVVFADAHGGKAAFLSVDACLLDRSNVARIREVIAAGCDVPPAHVLVHATHTHSGPATTDVLDFGVDLAPFRVDIDAFLSKAASAVVAASGCLEPASLAVGYATEDRISFNRRLRRKDGTTQMNWEALWPDFDPEDVVEAWGGTDPQVTCLAIEHGGRPAAGVVNFGLHPAILAGDNWLYSADYPGYLAESLRRTIGSGFTCLLANGCCGNVNHVDYRDRAQGRGYQMTQRVGYMLGAAAREAINARTPVAADRVTISSERVSLERIKIGDEKRRWCEKVLDEARRNPPKGTVDGLPDSYYASTLLRMYHKQHEPDAVEVTVLRVGEAALVGLPGECFCELGLRIKERSPARHTLVAGLCNDAIGYIPSRESFPQGGYEPLPGSTFYEAGADERLVASALAQLGRLFSA
ncbi:MAG: neutral/alkaline non-lysosomal ceramidase N-terminal domain-containing protein [Pirellulales bacterium]|nr:neutral/alkaline non-lysosomal ceramidase N-terminal domain-containing protein [Pirellulales bacterium]